MSSFVDPASVPEQLSVISGTSQFVPSPAMISAFMKKHGLYERGTNYSIVGIMGCQSSGKSTLLNLLFGTKFEELDSSKGRSMTTKGIWFGGASNAKDILVLDLEGTDSANRADDRGAYERQSALFALALTEVLIINMWQSDIGRYVAANYGVLSTIFEANLRLFAHDSKGAKTVLLFIIRDHDQEETPLDTLKEQLTRDVEKIWTDSSKTSEFQNSKYTDLFELQFYSLPHKKFQEARFIEQVKILRTKFVENVDGSYFATPFHQKKSVPADALGKYSEHIWESILKDKDLNIPSEKKMLANFRCDEIIHECLLKADPFIKDLLNKVREEYYPEFKTSSSDIFSSVMKDFDAQTSGYDSSVVSKKREECVHRISEELRVPFSDQLGHIRSRIAEKLKKKMHSKFSKDRVSGNFFSDAESLMKQFEAEFDELASSSKLDDVSWSLESVKKDLEKDFLDIRSSCRSIQLDGLNDLARGTLKQELGVLNEVFTKSDSNLWENIASLRAKIVLKLIQDMEQKLKGFKPSSNELVNLKRSIIDSSAALVLEEAQNHANYLKLKMHQVFDQAFKFEKDGKSTRHWKPSDNIRSIFEDCALKAEKVADLYRELRMEDGELSAIISEISGTEDEKSESGKPIELLSESTLKDTKLQFRNEISASLIQAELAAERAKTAPLPAWVIPLILFLGWNELIAIFSSPLLFMLIVFCLIGYIVVRALGMETAAFALLKHLLNQGRQLVMSHLSPSSSDSPSPRTRTNSNHQEVAHTKSE